MTETVLVVDDEERIRSSLRGILSDEGFRVLDTGDAPAVMEIIARERPALVLLDVGCRNSTVSSCCAESRPDEPAVEVIMISGHANIQNAVAATKLGAEDFIEKPFSVMVCWPRSSGCWRAKERRKGRERSQSAPGRRDSIGARRPAPVAPRPANDRALDRDRRAGAPFRTQDRSYPPSGAAGFGIVFSSLADQSAIAARLENVSDTGYNTTLTGDGHSVRTVEHLMSALHGFGITNLLVKTDDEVPALDGSAP